ncbi:MAG TPA: hypothetical protein VHG51_03765 [Longimicrobiaceae bacterium]|nr:hypothetical protein [Longimicrobiaceae bacterium]
MALARVRTAAALLVGALALTAASSAVRRTRPEVQDWDCPPAPASCARPVVVLGFPLPYVSDYHGISVVGSASLVGAVLGEDLFHAGAFWADVAAYLALLAGGRALAGARS